MKCPEGTTHIEGVRFHIHGAETSASAWYALLNSYYVVLTVNGRELAKTLLASAWGGIQDPFRFSILYRIPAQEGDDVAVQIRKVEGAQPIISPSPHGLRIDAALEISGQITIETDDDESDKRTL